MKRQSFFFVLAILLCLVSSCLYAITVENPRKDLHLSPGATGQTRIMVVNRSNKAGKMKVYQTDYSFKADGSNAFDAPGSHERSNANWIKFSPEEFVVQPKSSIEIQIAASVPDNKSLSGTYWSMLMFEHVDEIKTSSNQPSKKDINSKIQTIRRQGVQLRTHIAGTGEMKAIFSNNKTVKKESINFFEIDIENTGTLFYRGEFKLELFNQEGYPVHKFELPVKGIYPGCSVKYSAELKNVKKGDYTALCIFDTRSQKVFGGKYQISVP